jgi:hypothetical protein
MKATITTLNSFNFHEVVTLVWETINAGGGVGYKRAEAENYVKGNADKIVALEIDDSVFGMYGYYENPHTFTLSFFALDKRVRSKKIGYSLYLDMKKRLRGKPIIVPVYNDNSPMISLVKKRGKFIGRYVSIGNKLLDYYAVDFGDKE